MKTRKVGISGKFGSRYGKTIRERYIANQRLQIAKHVCPRCAKTKVVRESAGIWRCETCGLKFAGKAYKPA